MTCIQVLVRNPDGKMPFGLFMCGWTHDIENELMDISCVDKIHFAEYETLQIEAGSSSEKPVNSFRTTRRHIKKDSCFQI